MRNVKDKVYTRVRTKVFYGVRDNDNVFYCMSYAAEYEVCAGVSDWVWWLRGSVNTQIGDDSE